MTKGEAISRANWYLGEVNKSAYIFRGKQYEGDSGYFVLIDEDGWDLQLALMHADLIEYCDARMNRIDRDVTETYNVGHC